MGHHLCRGLSVTRGDAQTPGVGPVHTEWDPALVVNIGSGDCVAGAWRETMSPRRFCAVSPRLGGVGSVGSGGWPRDRVKGKCASPAGTHFPRLPALRVVRRTLGSLLVLLTFRPDFMVDFSDISTVKHAECWGHREPYSPQTNSSRPVPRCGAGGGAQEPWATRTGRLCPRPLGGSVCAREDLGGSVDRSVTRFPVPGLWSTGIATLLEKRLDPSVTHWSWRLFHFVCGLRSFLRFRKCIEDAHRNLSL